MRNFLFFAFMVLSFISNGQSTLITNQKTVIKSNNYLGFLHEVPGQAFINTSNHFLNGIGLYTSISKSLNLAVNNGPAAVKMTAANIEHVNYTAFGSNAPLIKTKILTGVTPGFDGSSTSSSPLHGIPDYTKILAVSVEVSEPASGITSARTYPEEQTYVSGYQVSYFINGGAIVVINSNGNSFNVRNMPFKVYITYEQ
jgi:hypothetical protein